MSAEQPQTDTSGAIIATAPLRAGGLHSAGHFELVEIARHVHALVVGLRRDAVELAPLTTGVIEIGAPVRRIGPAKISAAPSLEGTRTLRDLLARSGASLLPLTSASRPARWTAAAPPRRFDTGLLVYDIMGRLHHGDAILLCHNGVSRAVYLHMLRRLLIEQERSGGRCIYVRLRPAAGTVSARELLDRIAAEDQRHHWSRTLFLELGPDAAPAQALLLLRAATALAQSWSDDGADVTVVVDEPISRHRLDFGALPDRGSLAEPGMLTSIARRTASGSVTVILGAAARPTASIAQFFDHRVDLRRALSGSIDHRGSKLARPPLRVEPLGAVGALVSASALADDIAGGAETGDNTDQLRGQTIQQVLSLRIAGNFTLAEQLLCALAVTRCRDIDAANLARFVHRFIAALRHEMPDYLASLRPGAAVRCDAGEAWLTVARRTAEGLEE